ncbi:hypothetical protein GSS87_08790 [Corynebacterium sp. 4HC-13]|uniref:Fluoride-specific ion channel n=2 Tax=Corynebacterium anserum TaxID=2684406 RepID=A0A7G7YRE1_9CORY|nr:hypothetical protein [Corynebacterium anserum]QNH97061.1 hypothetical protein GP473_09150 [Corynebacterium anserum]
MTPARKDRSSHRTWMPQRQALYFVFCGGALGVLLSTAVRAGLAPFLSTPLALALVNILGAFALGFLVGKVPDGTSNYRNFFGTGFLGGFTSFSSIAGTLIPNFPRALLNGSAAVSPAVVFGQAVAESPVGGAVINGEIDSVFRMTMSNTIVAVLVAYVSLIIGIVCAGAGLQLANRTGRSGRLSEQPDAEEGIQRGDRRGIPPGVRLVDQNETVLDHRRKDAAHGDR